MNKSIVVLVLTSITLLFHYSCKDDITTPIEDKPGRREYVWTVDTVYTFNYIRRLWGSSPTDVWALSTGTFTNDIHHYNGNKWESGSYLLPSYYAPYSIYGFSSDNFFICGENGRIWHYDGSSFKEFAALTKDGRSDIVFDNIWGESSKNFYAFGAYTDEEGYANNPVIAHYINKKWEMLNTDGLFGIVEHLYQNWDNKVYLQVIGGRDYNDSTKIYEYSGGKYYNLYSNVWTQGLQADISLINNEVYFAIGNEIKRRVNNKFETVITVENPNFYQRIWGRNSKDIFLLMVDGLAHYNGTDTEYLFYFNVTPRTQIYGAALFKNEVFFLVYEDKTHLSLIYRGILKE